MTAKSKKNEERDAALVSLRGILKPGDSVYTILKHVSSSGMMRVIDLVIPFTFENSYATEATSPKLKVGAQGYGTEPGTGRQFSAGTVESFDAETVTFAYDACTTAPAESVTYPRASSKFYTITKRPGIRSISGLASDALGYAWDDRGGLRIGGGGMDMGFHAVFNLGRVLWPKGTPKPHGTRNGTPDSDGGYALNHVWL